MIRIRDSCTLLDGPLAKEGSADDRSLCWGWGDTLWMNRREKVVSAEATGARPFHCGAELPCPLCGLLFKTTQQPAVILAQYGGCGAGGPRAQSPTFLRQRRAQGQRRASSRAGAQQRRACKDPQRLIPRPQTPQGGWCPQPQGTVGTSLLRGAKLSRPQTSLFPLIPTANSIGFIDT